MGLVYHVACGHTRVNLGVRQVKGTVMPAWISIYCTESTDDVRADQMLTGIRVSDYWTLAEHYGIDEDLVDPALALLKIDSDDDGWELCYRPAGERQLAIHRWASRDRTTEEVDEVLESFEDDSNELANRILGHLSKVQTVIGIEMGFSQLEDMGIVFAFEIARWFGLHKGGLIRDDEGNWSMIARNASFVYLQRESGA